MTQATASRICWYSPSRDTYYLENALPEGTTDAIFLTEDDFAAVMAAQREGKTPRYENGAWVMYAPDAPPLDVRLHHLRQLRDRLLAKCDWTQVPDSPLTPEQRAAWAAYRQALRDVPQQCPDAMNVAWPAPPA